MKKRDLSFMFLFLYVLGLDWADAWLVFLILECGLTVWVSLAFASCIFRISFLLLYLVCFFWHAPGGLENTVHFCKMIDPSLFLPAFSLPRKKYVNMMFLPSIKLLQILFSAFTLWSSPTSHNFKWIMLVVNSNRRDRRFTICFWHPGVITLVC